MPKRALAALLAVVTALGWMVASVGPASAAPLHQVVATSVTGSLASSTIVKGQSVKANLTAVPATSGTARLQYKSGTKWVTDSRAIAVSAGMGATSLKPSATRTYRFSYGGKVSNSFTVTVVAAIVKGSLASAQVVKGQSVKASLTAVPATSGTARLQYKSGTKWVTDSRAIAVSAGKGATSLKPSTTRTYRFAYAGVVSNSFTVKVVASVVPTAFAVKGSGWGHGVGMSQYGAYGMALDGYTASQILTHYYSGTSVMSVDATGGGDFRVQVFGSGSDSASSVDMVVRSPGADSVANGQWRMRFYDADRTSQLAEWTGVNNEHLAVARSGSNIVITRANGSSFAAPWVSLEWEGTRSYQPTSAEDPYVELLDKPGGTARTHGQYRHGRLLLSVLSSRINIVNSLNLNTEYLYGVAEMPSSWSAEALKAQAIAARGYALRYLAKGVSATCGCNVYDDSRSQNFSGWKKENEGTDGYYGARWMAAVDATNQDGGNSGQVLSDGEGAIATTYYFSSSGGQTEDSEDVWTSPVDYLRSVEDPWSLASAVKNPNASWTATVSQATAKAAFGLTDVVSIAITSRTSAAPTAAAFVATATSSTGQTATLTGADKIRTKLGLKSPWIWSIAASWS